MTGRPSQEAAEGRSQSGHHHDQNDVERALLRQPRGGRNDGFRRKGNKRAFDGHADEDDPIAEVVEYPKDDSCHEERGRDEKEFGRKKRKIGRKCKNGVRGRASFVGRLLFRPTKLIYRRGGHINYGAVAFTSVGLFFEHAHFITDLPLSSHPRRTNYYHPAAFQPAARYHSVSRKVVFRLPCGQRAALSA